MNELSDDLRNRAQTAFEIATQRRGVTLSDRALAELTSKAISIADAKRSRSQQILSHGNFKPSVRVAVLLAEHIRRVLNISDVEPLFDLPALMAESLGIETIEIDENEISGACAILAGQPMLFIPQSDSAQQLFVCAHELAHVISISSQGESAIIDRVGDSLGTAKSPHEHFADNVALRLLIPQRGLGIALKETRRLLRATGPLGDVELLYVSRIFGVSFLAIGKRCEQANLIPTGGAAALDRFLLEKFGGAEKRAQELDLPPRPIFSISSRRPTDNSDIRAVPRPVVRSARHA